MFLEPLQYLLGALSGSLVGFTLGLFGGGGSILAVPLMVYVVGVPVAHVAIGTSAFAVAANALINLWTHARKGNVLWRCALMFTAAGIAGAVLGSMLGKAMDGEKLLFLFAILMLVIGALMFKSRDNPDTIGASCSREKAPKVLAFGGLTGIFSGFFGIGGGFLIVPGLVAATGMTMLNAIGSSLVAVTAFGLTTALSYAFSGLVDWPLAAVFIGGGFLGGLLGAKVAGVLARQRGMLNIAFAGLIVAVAIYMIIQTGATFLSV